MNLEVNEVLGIVMAGLLVAGILAAITILIGLWKRIGELWDVHLGPHAIDIETGLPRWYSQDAKISELFSTLNEQAKETRKVISTNTEVMRALLLEIQVERSVAKRVEESLKRKVDPVGQGAD